MVLIQEVLSRDSILGADDLTVEKVEISEWGGFVNVKTLTAKERDDFESSMVETRGRGRNQTREIRVKNLRAGLAVRAIVDDEGNRIFGDKDVDELGKKAGSALDKIYDVAARLAGISQTDADELLGNSNAELDEGSSSNSL